jgi:hypothetical protein
MQDFSSGNQPGTVKSKMLQLPMNKSIYLVVIISGLILEGCKHNPDVPPPCAAGPGGNVIIVVYAEHENTPLPNYYTHPDTAFVKFGTTASPGTHAENYDTYYMSEPGEDHIHCMGLQCGDYFIYRTAWDSVANVTRYGGYGISFSETTGDKEIHIAVN